MKIKWGSPYAVVQNLEKHGLLEAIETLRQGAALRGRSTGRLTELQEQIAHQQESLAHYRRETPRLFLVEAEYELAIREIVPEMQGPVARPRPDRFGPPVDRIRSGDPWL